MAQKKSCASGRVTDSPNPPRVSFIKYCFIVLVEKLTFTVLYSMLAEKFWTEIDNKQ